jgi:hypothetical protein
LGTRNLAPVAHYFAGASAPKTTIEESIQSLSVALDQDVPTLALGDVQGRAEHIACPAEEVWRALDPTVLSLVPILQDALPVPLFDRLDAVDRCNVLQNEWIGYVTPLLEEGFAKRKTHGLTRPVRLPIGTSGLGEGGQGGRRKSVGIESNEELRWELFAEFLNVCGGYCGILGSSVDEFQGPRTDAEYDVVASALLDSLADKT